MGTEPRLVLHGLAATLEAIAAEGAAAVYSGEVGRRLVADLAEQGGRLALDDLASVRATVRDALRIPRGAATLFAMPGLYAGTTLARCIELLGDAPEPRDFAEVLRRAYAERLANLGDSGDGGGAPPACTSHLCTVDRDGMTVALTQTLLSLFGSKVVSPSTGMLLNNGVMWFDPRPGRPNSLAAGKRPLANMCPVIGQDGGRWLALGASGGRKILPAVLQLACAIVDRGLDLGAAFAAPRIDASGGALVVADARLPAAVRADLAARFPLRETTAMVYPLSFACPSAVLRDEATGEVWGAAEPVQPWAGARAEP
jgi:gamma-glutamyltranspeptidase/glutathione hydrolase